MCAGENIGVHEGPRQNALTTDSSPYIEALLFDYTPDNFLSYFPAIPYSKGASVWNMLEAYWDTAGPDAFQVHHQTKLITLGSIHKQSTSSPLRLLLLDYSSDSFIRRFPSIALSKGASVCNMLEAYWDTAGPDAFQVNLHN